MTDPAKVLALLAAGPPRLLAAVDASSPNQRAAALLTTSGARSRCCAFAGQRDDLLSLLDFALRLATHERPHLTQLERALG